MILKRNFVKNAFFKKFYKKKLKTDLTRNLISSCPCPWASVAKFTAKSDHPFLSNRVDKGFWPFGHCDLDLWPLTSKQGWGHTFCGWYQHTIRWLLNSYGKVPKNCLKVIKIYGPDYTLQKMSFLKLRCAVAKNWQNPCRTFCPSDCRTKG